MAYALHYLSQFRDRLVDLAQRTGILQHSRLAAGIAAGVVAASAVAWFIAYSRRPSAAELERRRREQLTLSGRITDGSIVDARSHGGEESISISPDLLLYRYRIAGVTYDCAQDVSQLPTHTAGFRIDQPVQVRYDPRNPGNSIIVSETWSGLRMNPQRFLLFDTPIDHHHA